MEPWIQLVQNVGIAGAALGFLLVCVVKPLVSATVAMMQAIVETQKAIVDELKELRRDLERAED